MRRIRGFVSTLSKNAPSSDARSRYLVVRPGAASRDVHVSHFRKDPLIL